MIRPLWAAWPAPAATAGQVAYKDRESLNGAVRMNEWRLAATPLAASN